MSDSSCGGGWVPKKSKFNREGVQIITWTLRAQWRVQKDQRRVCLINVHVVRTVETFYSWKNNLFCRYTIRRRLCLNVKSRLYVTSNHFSTFHLNLYLSIYTPGFWSLCTELFTWFVIECKYRLRINLSFFFFFCPLCFVYVLRTEVQG